MKYYIFLSLCLLISINSFNLRSTKQYYDSYVMSLYWVNGYCKEYNCTNPDLDKLEPNILTIHGLWPSLKSGKMLDPCTSGVKIEETDPELFAELKKSWTTFYGTYTDFWEHEYNKHGYCMVQEYNWDGYEDYFRFTNNLYKALFKNIIQQVYHYDSKSRVVTVYKELFQLRLRKIMKNATIKMLCKNWYITEIYFYLNKDFSASPDSSFSEDCKIGNLIFK